VVGRGPYERYGGRKSGQVSALMVQREETPAPETLCVVSLKEAVTWLLANGYLAMSR